MVEYEIRAYGPNYDIEHLCVDLDKKVRALGGATIVIVGDDPDLRAMQAHALSDSLGLQLTKNPIKAEERHSPDTGVTMALHCTDRLVMADSLVEDWVLNTAIPGPRILFVENVENGELAVSALGTCAVLVKADSRTGMLMGDRGVPEIPSAGLNSSTIVTVQTSGYEDPHLCMDFNGMARYRDLMDQRAGLEYC